MNLYLLPVSGALFSDQEKSSDNFFRTTNLDLGFNSVQTGFEPALLMPDKESSRSALINQIGALPFIYSQKYQFDSGDETLCQNLHLEVLLKYYDLHGILQITNKYSGSLVDFSINTNGLDGDLSFPTADYYPNPDYGLAQHWFEYQVSLPDDPNPNLGNLSCNFSYVAKAWMQQHSYGQAFWDEEILANSVSTGSWAKVTGMKFNDLDGNGDKDEAEPGLEGWNIFAAQEVEELSVPADDNTGIDSEVLENGATYLVRVTGTYQADTDLTADAKYSVRNPDTNWTDTVNGLESYGYELLDLQIDGASPDWGPYASDHEYWTSLVGTGASVNFKIYDILYTNNTGNLNVTIFKVVSSDITDTDGLYELDLSNVDGEIVVAEENQTGWQQTMPSSKYYVFPGPDLYEDIDFGNHKIPAGPEFTKIVINEVYYDVANTTHCDEASSEWIELYNPNNFAVNIKNWSLSDNAGSVTITGNPEIPAYGFALLSHDNGTWIHCFSDNGAVIVQLAGAAAWLNNDGDQLTLRNSDDQIVDFVAWEQGSCDGGTCSNNFPHLYPDWTLAVAEGHSIARSPLGFDTDSPSDWIELATPNPGTNPHSHISVSVDQEDSYLLIGFSNAWGFDELDYAISYHHLYSNEPVEETIKGKAYKPLNQNQLILDPIFLGTCSDELLTCVAHTGIGTVSIDLLYKDGDTSIGTSTITFPWQEK
ncbi:lamin tail domain-containing protein [Candidatus Beckwithbacteria bacterium]|nr:lamin tail domain-containing protein [Candidatus Beckwithbacteria bacterium]